MLQARPLLGDLPTSPRRCVPMVRLGNGFVLDNPIFRTAARETVREMGSYLPGSGQVRESGSSWRVCGSMELGSSLPGVASDWIGFVCRRGSSGYWVRFSARRREPKARLGLFEIGPLRPARSGA
jgi:hypothetical protein